MIIAASAVGRSFSIGQAMLLTGAGHPLVVSGNGAVTISAVTSRTVGGRAVYVPAGAPGDNCARLGHQPQAACAAMPHDWRNAGSGRPSSRSKAVISGS